MCMATCALKAVESFAVMQCMQSFGQYSKRTLCCWGLVLAFSGWNTGWQSVKSAAHDGACALVRLLSLCSSRSSGKRHRQAHPSLCCAHCCGDASCQHSCSFAGGFTQCPGQLHATICNLKAHDSATQHPSLSTCTPHRACRTPGMLSALSQG